MILNLKEIIKKYNCKINGIIHLGAHTAEEKDVYDELDVPVIWIDANRELCDRLRKKGLQVVCAVISDRVGDETFYITNNTACDSLLKPKRNLTWGKGLTMPDGWNIH